MKVGEVYIGEYIGPEQAGSALKEIFEVETTGTGSDGLIHFTGRSIFILVPRPGREVGSQWALGFNDDAFEFTKINPDDRPELFL